MAIGKEIIELQEKIGYFFSDIENLETALTHSSYSNEMKDKGRQILSNERLEFLGDAVLQIIISEMLYEKYRNRREGSLTKMRQYLVCEKTLYKLANKISLGEYLNLGKGEEKDCRKRPKVLADALEALFGAVYLDSLKNLSALREVILSLYGEEIDYSELLSRGDAKTLLQELVEKEGASTLEYFVVEESGPEHNKTFSVEVKVDNNVVGRADAKTKKEAEMKAARSALSLFGVEI